MYFVIGGPLGSVVFHVRVTWPSESLAFGVRGDSSGAATAAGVPTDCLTTAGP